MELSLDDIQIKARQGILFSEGIPIVDTLLCHEKLINNDLTSGMECVSQERKSVVGSNGVSLDLLF